VNPPARLIAFAGTIAVALAVGCDSPERQAAAAAEDTSQVAATPEQKQLWQDAADKGDTPGLQRVPIPPEPVIQRAPSQAPGAQPKPQPPSITITPGVRNELRVVLYPDDPFQRYTGPARVTKVEQNGERIEVQLPPGASGTPRTLALLVRLGTKPLPVKVGEMVDVAYQLRRDPQLPEDAIGIRNSAGAGIVHVIQGGNVLVQAVIPLFGLNAKQVDNQPGSPVQFIGVTLKPIDLTIGQTSPVDGAMARVIGNTVPAGKPVPGLTEGAPFTLNVMVWRVP
jgi:hypothetical protein